MSSRQPPPDVVDRILTMRKIEASYCFQYFLQTEGQERKLPPLTAAWRGKITQWAFNVVDHFGLSRETVSVSMGIFDRYVATLGNKCSGNLVLLTSLTTLHMAIKLHETKRIKSSILANLSRDQFSTEHIDEMELKIVSALSWKLYPPTPLALISEFLYFLPAEVTVVEQREVYELSKYLTELAVCESSFVERQNSTVAFASLRIIMDSMEFLYLGPKAKGHFIQTIAEIMGLTTESQTMRQTRELLQVLFSKVAASESFGATLNGAHDAHSASAKIVTPSSGSPLSSGKSYDVISATQIDSRASDNASFWYTPSPPSQSTRSAFGVQQAIAAPIRQ